MSGFADQLRALRAQDDAEADSLLQQALNLSSNPTSGPSGWQTAAAQAWEAIGHGVPEVQPSASAGQDQQWPGGQSASPMGSSSDVRPGGLPMSEWISGHGRGGSAFPGPLRASARPEMLAFEWVGVRPWAEVHGHGHGAASGTAGAANTASSSSNERPDTAAKAS